MLKLNKFLSPLNLHRDYFQSSDGKKTLFRYGSLAWSDDAVLSPCHCIFNDLSGASCMFVPLLFSSLFFFHSQLFIKGHIFPIQNGNGTLVWLLNTRVHNFHRGFEGFPRICHIQFTNDKVFANEMRYANSEFGCVCKWNIFG